MSKYEVEWENGICGCFNDCSLCILTYCCSCYVFGKTAEAVGEDCCLCCLAFCSPFILIARLHVRERIRQKKDLRGTYGIDLCQILFCGCCSLVQEAQEVKDLRAQPMMRE